MAHLYAYESLAAAYYLYLVLTAALVPGIPGYRRARVAAIAAVMIGTINVVAESETGWVQDARIWLPLVYLVTGYWLPAQIVVRSRPSFEQMLFDLDMRIFGHCGLRSFRQRAPRAAIQALELAYLACYPLVPLGFLSLAITGHAPADANRFWLSVLGAALPCYGLLPWLPSRPPRVVEAVQCERGAVRDLNVRVLRDVSVGWNTFPSGHAAASVATALAVGAVLPFAGLAFGLVAAGICIGSVVGRYHYTADAIAGIALAVVAFGTTQAILVA